MPLFTCRLEGLWDMCIPAATTVYYSIEVLVSGWQNLFLDLYNIYYRTVAAVFNQIPDAIYHLRLKVMLTFCLYSS